MQPASFHRLTMACIATTIFVSAFLLFQVQPIMGKYILPWFGGSTGVWTTCMLFFQVVLFAGYAYAHLLHRWFTIRGQVTTHVILLVLAMLTLPIAPSAEWKPSGEESPIGLILLLLVAKVGFPYFLLSSTGPLLQSWLASSSYSNQPYRLYSLSNIGSLLALLSFPFAFEPIFSSSQQATIWSWAFAGFVLLCIVSGVALSRTSLGSVNSVDDPVSRPANTSSEVVQTIEMKRRLAWFGLPALASMMLLATTNQICIDTAVIPFLWIIPLSIYLISFILTFDSSRWYSRRAYIMLAAVAFTALYFLKLVKFESPLLLSLGIYFVGLLGACMVCHGELVRLKPNAQHLTSFYLTMSAGGACGGLFVGLLAPLIFRGYFEWQLSLLACILLFADCYLRESAAWCRIPLRFKIASAAAIVLIAMFALDLSSSKSNHQIAVTRNFYGVLSVNRVSDRATGNAMLKMVHGHIVHGSQFEADDKCDLPTAYYTSQSGVGRLLSNFRKDQSRRVGVIGLGAGTLACYGRSGDLLKFYEINPAVVQLAQEYFTFLKRSQASCEIKTGDGRLVLEREPSQCFDVLVLDAFSGDAIPVHLLTKQAMVIYDSHLASDGVIAVHISNLYLDLRAIVDGLAEEFGYHSILVDGPDSDIDRTALKATWILMSKNPQSLADAVGGQSPASIEELVGKPVLWTDEKSNLLQAIK